ncbi:MAG: AsmA family protein [Cohaesibacter sp.]|nr:AsmA family protein [Cohaesibacter sp.]
MSATTKIRMLWGFGMLLVFVIGLVMISPYLVNSKVVKQQISEQISDWAGLPVTVRGEPIITVFPYLSVKLKDVSIVSNLGKDEPALVAMDHLRAEMYWLPLLIGHFEVRRFNLVRPRFHLERRTDGSKSWGVEKGSLFSTNEAGSLIAFDNVDLGRFIIQNGQVRYIDETKARDETIFDANLSVIWPNTERSAEISGSMVWRGEHVLVQAQSEKPMELITGGLSPLVLEAKSNQFELTLEGSAATLSNLQMEGDLTFKAQSMRYLMEWLGFSIKPGANFGAMDLTARANMIGASLALSDIALMLDGNQLEGALQLDLRSPRALLQGTLAYDQLDLTPYLEQVDGAPSLLDQPITPHDLGLMDIDIRLSAQQILFKDIELGRTAASIVTRNQQLSLSIGESFAYGGSLDATLDMKPSETDPNLLTSHLRGKASGVLAGSLLKAVKQEAPVSGTMLAELDLSGNGLTLRETAFNASGSLSMVFTDGQIASLNLVAIMEALSEQQPLTPDALYQGGTGFDVLSISSLLGDHKASLEGLRLTAGNLALSGTGSIMMGTSILDFRGQLIRYRSDDPTTHSKETPEEDFAFSLTGPWSRPVLRQNSDILDGLSSTESVTVPGVPDTVLPKAEPGVPHTNGIKD